MDEMNAFFAHLEETPAPHSPAQLVEVHVLHSTFGYTARECHLDIPAARFFDYRSRKRWTDRDPKLENEGYQRVIALTKNRLQAFLTEPVVTQALAWRSRYIRSEVRDGLQWWITFSFSDGASWEVFGSNAYPEGWREFEDAFFRLADEEESQ